MGANKISTSRKTSLLRVGMFALALFANLAYLLFIVNPLHADSLGMFTITAVADTIAIIIFTSTWIIALYFELFKQRYYGEVDELRAAGQYLLNRRVAVFVPVMNEDRGLIRNTVASLQALRGEKEIYLLDDAHKPATVQLAADMNVHYISRTGNEFFKAGNLNHALKQTGGNKQAAAKLLGLKRTTFAAKLRRCGVIAPSSLNEADEF